MPRTGVPFSYRFSEESLFRGDQVAEVCQSVSGCVQFVGAVCAHLHESRWAPEARAFEQEGQDLVDDVAAFSPADVRIRLRRQRQRRWMALNESVRIVSSSSSETVARASKMVPSSARMDEGSPRMR